MSGSHHEGPRLCRGIVTIEQLDIRDADNRLLARLETDASLAENPLFTLHLRPTSTPLLRASSQDNDGNHYTATLPLAP